jgi:aspartyl aminopeptidase
MTENITAEKSAGQKLQEKLFLEKKSSWEGATDELKNKVRGFADGYKLFMDKGKTEREFCAESIACLEKQGFQDFDKLLKAGKKPEAGMALYRSNRGKSVIMAVLGTKPVSEGLNILGAHIDSPRLDLKTNPLYEDSGLAMLDTHYYGGIKKYQWPTIPLALHGVIIKNDGTKLELCVGEDDKDPVLVITDLLPHLGSDQMKKTASELFSGEDLDVLAGSIPYNDEKVKEKVKLNVLNILHEKYGISEEDFTAAELELVPAAKAKDVGFDRSMIGAYGHDDKSCAYTALYALAGFAGKKAPAKTVLAYLSDKEEIGSVGNTGAASRFFEDFLDDLAEAQAAAAGKALSGIERRAMYAKSSMLSADVGAAFDPRFADVYDKKNACYLGLGIMLSKYTGHGGKAGGSDANAEFYSRVLSIFDKNKVAWQFGDLGKVDKGGGGTIALFAANLGIEVLDCGIPVLSMHSPWEVISSMDLYQTYLAYLAFLQEA